MKKFHLLLIIVLFLTSLSVFSQEDSTIISSTRKSKLYLNIGTGIFWNPDEIWGFGLNAIFPNNWGFSLSYNYYSLIAKDLPADYSGGFFSFVPYDNIGSFSIRVMKEFDPFSKFIRFGIEIGPSLVLYEKLVFKPYNSSNLGDKNYETSTITENSLGLSLRVKIEIPAARILGVEIAAISNINKYQSYVGYELHYMIGCVRDKIKP